MARDDFDDGDDDRPRRRPRRDDDEDDRPARPSRRRYDDDDYDRPPRKKSNTGLIVGILVGVFVVCCGGGGTVLFFIFRGAQKGVEQFQVAVEEAQDMQASQANLVRIGRAAHDHHDTLGMLPNNSYEIQGKQVRPLLSWRVHILPYMNENALYQQFKLNEPWDSPNNKPLISRMPAIFATPEAGKKAGAGMTYYRGFAHQGAVFEKPQFPGGPNFPKATVWSPQVRIADVVDGSMNTILVVESGEAVEWTKPDDIDWSPGRPRPSLGYSAPVRTTFTALMVSGEARQMPKDIADQTLRLLTTRADGQVIPMGWDRR